MAITEWSLHRTALSQSAFPIVLCDDDQAFLTELERELHRLFEKMNMRCDIRLFDCPAAIPADALERCTMAFLDIDFENDDCSGIDIARRLRQANKQALLFFVTNYIDYAPAGFEVQAFRYILKGEREEVLERYLLQAMEILAEKQEFLRLRDQDTVTDVPLKEIIWLEVMDHYVSIHAKAESFVLNATLSNLEKALEPHGFLRIHKSYLVNMAFIRKFRSRECLLADGTALAVGEKNYPQQKQKYLRWKGLQ